MAPNERTMSARAMWNVGGVASKARIEVRNLELETTGRLLRAGGDVEPSGGDGEDVESSGGDGTDGRGFLFRKSARERWERERFRVPQFLSHISTTRPTFVFVHN